MIELKTGQRVEGSFKGADQTAVRIEIGGQVLTFKPEQVRAIYYGAAPTGAPAQPSLVQEAMRVLKGLQSVVQGGITYRDYAPRVSDAKVVVDRYLQDSGEPDSPGKALIKDALAFYVFASSAWSAKITNDPWSISAHPMIERCPALRDKLARFSGEFRLRTISSEVPTIWSCASDKIAEAERLMGATAK